jgi:hypothetical protein
VLRDPRWHELETLRARLATAIGENVALRQSLSWKVTGPLRSVANLVGWGRRR